MRVDAGVSHLNDSDYFQMSDRCYIIDKMIQEILETHPVYFGDERIRKVIQNSAENLRTGFQLADGIGFTLQESKKNPQPDNRSRR
jgi:hypothetical protein